MTSIVVPKEFDKIFSSINSYMQMLGLDVLDPNYRPGWRTASTWIVMLYSFSTCGFALWKEREDLVQFLAIIPFVVFHFQGLHKCLLRAARPDRYKAIRKKSEEIFRLLNEKEYNGEALYSSQHITIQLQRIIIATILGAAVFLLALPIVNLLFTGEKVLAITLYFPGVDEKSTGGFWLNYFLHILALRVGGPGLVGVDGLFLAYVVPVSGYVDAIRNEVHELNRLLDEPDRVETAVVAQLDKICKLHQMLTEYEKLLEIHYSGVILAKVSTIIVGMISNIVVIFKSNFVQAYFLFAVVLGQLTQYCLLGTILTLKNEQLLGHIYAINWHLLPMNRAKHLCLMLQQGQNAPSITIGGYAPLNVESYVSILKTIYSYVMLVATFLE